MNATEFETSLRRSSIRYSLLQFYIDNEFAEHAIGDNNAHIDDNTDCCICLDQLSDTTKIITTTCRHSFHIVCLASYLRSGSECPLCRRAAVEMVPNTRDGRCLRFLAMIFLNMKAVDMCHKLAISNLRKNISSMENHPSQAIALQLANDVDQFTKLITYDSINTEGFVRLLTHFDQKTEFRVKEDLCAFCCTHHSFWVGSQYNSEDATSILDGHGRLSRLVAAGSHDTKKKSSRSCRSCFHFFKAGL
jgi:hypothetical protein